MVFHIFLTDDSWTYTNLIIQFLTFTFYKQDKIIGERKQGIISLQLKWTLWSLSVPTPMSPACLLSVENLSQRISLIREMQKQRKTVKGDQVRIT